METEAIERALQWHALIGTNGIESKADLARYLGISRASWVLKRLANQQCEITKTLPAQHKASKRTYRPVILSAARIPKRPNRSNAALNIRMSCVLGSTDRHMKAQNAAISPIRKTKDTMLPNINIL